MVFRSFNGIKISAGKARNGPQAMGQGVQLLCFLIIHCLIGQLLENPQTPNQFSERRFYSGIDGLDR